MSPKDVTVYMIGNAHIDPVWLWRWQEGFAEVLATCRSALDRMNEYPDFVFTRADAATYRWIEDSCPEMFREIRERVEEGRWNIVGGWWEQPDCNIPSGEAFVRHELYGKRYFLEKFGVDVAVGYNVDSFGHNAGLPQILAKAGIGYYVFMRPEAHEKTLPEPVFWWEGPDGSRVLVHRLRGPYCTGCAELTEHVANSAANRAEGTTASACFYGVGNHGGGPTIENIECIRGLQRDPAAPNLVFGTMQQMFEHILSERTDFPVVTGDLQHHAVGCYTAHSDVKKWNRMAENAVTSAERFCSMAVMAGGREFARPQLAEAWKKVLFNQFHDILAGTSLDVAYEDTRNALGAAIDTADYEANAALQSIACGVDTPGEGQAIVVFNPHGHEVISPIHFDQNAASLFDHTGREVPVQAVNPFYERTWPRATNVFVDTLPPLGYKVYYARESEAQVQADACTPLAQGTTINNGLLEVEVDPQTGSVVRIDERVADRDPLQDPAGPVVMEDPSDTWSHGVVRFDKLAGRFGDAKVEVVENGPVRATLRVESRFNESTVWQDISLYRGLNMVEFTVRVDWREKHRMLKYEFPLNLICPLVSADAAYAPAVHPADGAENPCQKWVDIGTETGFGGVSIINDGFYGYDCKYNLLRLSLLRSPIYAFHDPRQVEPGKHYHYMDQGMHTFHFALISYGATRHEAGVEQQAQVFNMPPVAVETFRHSGELAPEHSFGGVSEPNVQVCAIKEAEDGGATIVRLLETAGKATDATLALSGASYPLRMGAFELKTLRIADGKAVEVDLIEREIR